jgi:hypothetical protein
MLGREGGRDEVGLKMGFNGDEGVEWSEWWSELVQVVVE